MRVVAVIPARFGSTRLPGKPLAEIHGKPMIQWVYERVSLARGLDAVYVATDDQRVVSAVESFGGQVLMTASTLQSGTDRVAAVAERVSAEIYVNVQGDEPLMEPLAIERAVALVKSGQFSMATVMTPFKDPVELNNPAAVKVVVDHRGRALYFSRLPIPACRRHVGLYVYTRETLFKFRGLSPSRLELAESLEQLRALEAGIEIGTVELDFQSIGVDTPAELEKVRTIMGNH